jgi:threonine synthase
MMREMGIINRLPRLVCAQSMQANPLYRSYLTGFRRYRPMRAKKTLASAIQIGNPVSIEKAMKILAVFDSVVEQATEEELAEATALADRTGLFNCPHTGVALAALLKLVAREEIKPDHRVVVISTAHGLKFTEFKRRYHEEKLKGMKIRYANLPVELPADYNKVRDQIFRVMDEWSIKGKED